MATYTTLNDLNQWYGEQLIAELSRGQLDQPVDADVVNLAISAAAATIDGYLRTGYPGKEFDSSNTWLNVRNRDLAYLAMKQKVSGLDEGEMAQEKRIYKDLEQLAHGRIDLVDETADEVQAHVGVMAKSNPSVFGFQRGGNWG